MNARKAEKGGKCASDEQPRCGRPLPVAINSRRKYHRNMAMISATVEVMRVELTPAAKLFRSLGDPARLAIVRRLGAGPARVVDLVDAVGLAQSTVSKHLACLRDCGLVASDPVGRASLFRLTHPELVDVLAAAEGVLQATGNAIVLCPCCGSDSCTAEPAS